MLIDFAINVILTAKYRKYMTLKLHHVHPELVKIPSV
jgi:hypothetical protein